MYANVRISMYSYICIYMHIEKGGGNACVYVCVYMYIFCILMHGLIIIVQAAVWSGFLFEAAPSRATPLLACSLRDPKDAGSREEL